MDDVEAAGAELEVERLDVDDHLVALARPRRPAPRRPRPRRSSSPTWTVSGSSETTVPRRSFSTPATPGGLRDRSASQTAEHLDHRRGGDRLLGRVVGLGAVGEQHRLVAARRAARWRRCRRRSRPGWARARGARSASEATAHRPRVRVQPVAAEHLGHLRRRRRSPCSPAAQVQASTISPTTSAARSPSMLRASPTSRQRPATTFEAVPPSITPDVRGRLLVEAAELHRGDRRRRRLDRAVAVLGVDPGVRLLPREGRLEPLVGRRRDDHLADRASRGRARSRTGRAAPSMSSSLAPRSPSSSATVKTSSSPSGGGLGRVAGRQLHQHRDRGLVVGAEDRVAARCGRRRSSSTTSTGPSWGTVSRWAKNETQRLRAARDPRDQVARARTGGLGACRPRSPRRRAREARRARRRRPPAPRPSGSRSRRAGRSARACAGRRRPPQQGYSDRRSS